MNISQVIIFLGVLVILSHLFTYFFNKIKIPNVLLLMIIGVIVGPALHFVEVGDFGKVGPVFSNLTLLIILFESGTNLKLKEVGKAMAGSSMLALLMFAGTLALTAAAAHYIFDLNWIASAMIGAVVGGTSSAIVIPMIGQLKIHDECKTLLTMESALSDVLCLMSGLALFSAMKTGSLDIQEILKGIGINFGVSLLFGLVAGLLWVFILEKIRSTIKNSMFVTGAYIFIVYGAADHLGFNGGIAVLLLGITMGNIALFNRFFDKFLKIQPQEINENEKHFWAEIVFIFATYFFVFMGISMQFNDPFVYLIALGITIGIFALRWVLVQMTIHSANKKPYRSAIVAVAPKGLVPAILASLPLQAGLDDGELIQNVVFAIVFISIVISSLLVTFSQKNLPAVEETPNEEIPSPDV